MQRYIVSYDISKDKIRGRAYRKLKKMGISIQKSVFYVELNYSELVRLQKDMMDLIEELVNQEDRDYPMFQYLASEEAKLEKLYEIPEMIRTPVVRNGKKATVGYCPEIWSTWE